MKNNMIELANYRSTNARTSASVRMYGRGRRICSLIAAFADAFATIAIGICTIFCMYLAYTML